MTHTYSKLLFHLIWSTKNRESLITNDIKNRLYGYIRTIISDKEQFLVIINGMPDHVHLLVRLSPIICVSDFIRHIKTNSTKWMQSNPINLKTFSWQEGFAAYTIGYSTMPATVKYIENQENHHQDITYEDEYLNLLKMQEISYDPRFVLG
jgi:putative transposase